MTRINIASGTIWEKNFGYSRAVIIDSTIHISGTTSVDTDGKIIGKDNAYEQAKYILYKIKTTLEQNGFTINDIVRTRIYLTDIHNSDKVGKAHYEYFKNIRPVATMVEVTNLVNDNLLVEIEAYGVKASD